MRESLREISAFASFLAGLPAYLKTPLTAGAARQKIEEALGRRDEHFEKLIAHIFCGPPGSPYRRLFAHAGLERGDVSGLLRQHGLEGTLERLYEAGIYLTTAEFKQRKPVERPGLSFSFASTDLMNPGLAHSFEAQSGRSRGPGTRLRVDLGLLDHEAAELFWFRRAQAIENRPVALWRAVPPATAGIKNTLRMARIGVPVERWLSPVAFENGLLGWKARALAAATASAGLLTGTRMPWPAFLHPERAEDLALWLAEKRRAGRPGVVDAPCSLAVRIAKAALARGLDIEGSFFRLGGEPFTEAKERAFAAVGTRAACRYSMAEVGTLGSGCGARRALDDVHLMTDKTAFLFRPHPPSPGLEGSEVWVTALLPSSPVLALNVESGDLGQVERRTDCCALGEIGFAWHLSGIRSYEKLTGSGVTFISTELYRLVEEDLPKRFGGGPMDYQLVEREDGGETRVFLRIHPRLGTVDEASATEAVFASLAAVPGGKVMGGMLANARAVAIERAPPHLTPIGKFIPLVLLGASEGRSRG